MAQTDKDFELLLLDDGSSDGTADMAVNVVSPTTVVTGKGKWWWAGALQKGFEWLRDEQFPVETIVMIGNDDTTFGPEFLENARRAISAMPGSLVLATLHDAATRDLIEIGAHVNWERLEVHGVKDAAAVNCFSTRGLFGRLGDFRKLGRWHPRLLPHYLSDYEYTMRAARHGLSLRSDPALSLLLDRTLTGHRGNIDGPPGQFIARTFSRRNAGNPVAWTMFILMRCPPRFVPVNLFRVWRRFAFDLARSFSAIGPP